MANVYRDNWNTEISGTEYIISRWGGNENDSYSFYQQGTIFSATVQFETQTITLSYDVAELTDLWNHFSLTYDGNEITLLLNGVVVASENRSGEINYGADNQYYGNFVFGAKSTLYGVDNTSASFGGALSDVRLLSTALSATEIKTIAAGF